MCYSGKCSFENHMGDCTARDFNKFKSETGERACYVGGFPDCEEAEKYIEENRENFSNLRVIACEKKLVW